MMANLSCAPELEGTLRLKVNLNGYWLVWQHYENHVLPPLCLFKLNTVPFYNIGQDGEYVRSKALIKACRQLMLVVVSDQQQMLATCLQLCTIASSGARSLSLKTQMKTQMSLLMDLKHEPTDYNYFINGALTD